MTKSLAEAQTPGFCHQELGEQVRLVSAGGNAGPEAPPGNLLMRKG